MVSEETNVNGKDLGRTPNYNLLQGKWLSSPKPGDEIVISGIYQSDSFYDALNHPEGALVSLTPIITLHVRGVSDCRIRESGALGRRSEPRTTAFCIRPPKISAVSRQAEIIVTFKSSVAGCFSDSANIEEFKNKLMNKVDMVTPNRHWRNVHSELPKRTGTLPEVDKFDAGFFGIHERQGHAQDAMIKLSLERSIEAVLDAGLHPSDLENSRTGVYVGVSFSEFEKTIFIDKKIPQSYGVTGCARSMIAHRISHHFKLKGPSFATDTACSSSLYALEQAFRAIRLGEIDNAIVGGTNLCLDPYVSLQFTRLGVLSDDGSCKVFDEDANGYVRAEAVGILILQKAKDAKRNYAELVYAKTNCDGYKENGINFPSKMSQKKLLEEFYDDSGIDRFSLSYVEAHGTGTPVGDPQESFAIDEVLAKGKQKRLLVGSVKSNVGHAEPASGISSVVKCIIGLESGIIPPNIHFIKPNNNLEGIRDRRMKIVSEPMPFDDDNGLIGINSFGFGGANCHVLLRKNRKEKSNSGIPSDDIPRIIGLSGRTEESVITLLDDLKSNVPDVEHIRLLHNCFRLPIANHLYRGFSIVSKSGEMCRFFDTFPGKLKPLYLAFGELNEWYHIGNHLMALPVFSDTIQRIQKEVLAHGFSILDTFSKESSDRVTYHILGSVAVQLGLIDLLKLINVKPECFYGYSFGNLISAYASGAMSLEDSVYCALILNDSINRTNELYGNGIGKEQMKHQNRNEVCSLDKLKEKLQSEKSVTARTEVLQNLKNFIKSNAVSERLTEKTLAFADRFVDSIYNNVPQDFLRIENNSIFLTVGTFPIAENLEDVALIPLFRLDKESHLVGFLEVLGSLYVNGHNPKLALLYPDIEFPVSRGTKMISPYIKWKHDSRLWFCPLVDVLNKSDNQQVKRTFEIKLSDQDWSFVDGHVIDGRNLFPATGYLYLAWKSLADNNEQSSSVRNVVFKNCKFMRATTISSKGHLMLKVSMNIVSGHFEIMEGESTVMSGTINIVYCNESDDDTDYTPIPPSYSSNLKMKTRDIYKELSLRGYNYKGSFRGIIESDVTGTEGRIKWEDNWVTLLDNMLQMKILGQDSRLLYVPTFIEYIKISPTDHAKWIQEEFTHKGKEPILPVHTDSSCGEIRCKNTVIRGLIANSIPRRKDLGIPVLEKYTFVPNVTNLELIESIRVNMQILLENTLVYKVKVIELIDEFTEEVLPVAPLVIGACEDQPLIQCAPKILSQCSLDVSIPVENTRLSEERDILLLIVSRFFGRPELSKTAFSSLKDNGFILSRESSDFSIADAEKFDVTILTAHKINSETHVLLKKNHCPRNPVTLKINSSDDFSWIEETKKLIQNKVSDSLILYSDNRDKSGVLGLVNCLRREPESTFIKGLLVMDDVQDINLDDSFYRKQLRKNMAHNVLKDGEWGTYRHLLSNFSSKVENEHCFAYPNIRGDLSSLQWFEGHLRHDIISPSEKELVYVYYSALNFRDIMTASGKLNADIVSSDRTEQECIQGVEIAGVDRKGNRISGLVSHQALATMVLVDKYLCFPVPDDLSLEEAVTIPVVYGTVLSGLIMRAGIKRGESILIHSGTGGVGQAAIRTALHYDCEVFTTVGTAEKREFLKKTFPQLKDSHIGNSRNTSFEKMVKKRTKGRGVDIVLNSLADKNLQASIRCLAKRGRFVEIGKFDLTQNATCNLLLLEKQCSFHGVMVDKIISSTPAVKSELTQLIKDGIEAGFVKPLNRTIFRFNQLEEAFRYMASGKHIGKVLIQIREPEKHLKTIPPVLLYPCTPRYSCNEKDSYIICGGLGGFGLEFADWLVLRGARKLILTSRQGVSTGYQLFRIKIWRSYGVTVQISKADITTKEGCRTLLKEAQKLGDVRGIFNLAVVLADAVFENQTEKSFSTLFGPKNIATKYLDELSRELCPNLSDFVVFSSVTCGRGNAGQTNYGMANSIMERICEERKKDGLPALAIQWGAIGQVGLVAEMQELDCELEIGGTLQQKISNCLNVLDGFLKQKDHTILSSMIVAEKRGSAENADSIIGAVTNILGLHDTNSVSLHATLAELGMDSITTVEVKQILETEFELFISAKDMRTMTLAKLKEIQENRIIDTQDDGDIAHSDFFLDVSIELYRNDEEISLPYIEFEPKQEIKTTSKVIFVPGVDGSARVFKTIAPNLDSKSIALQFVYSEKPESVQDMAKLLIPALEEHLSPDKPFTIVAYSFGSNIALEAVSILESKNYQGTVVVIDGSPEVMKKMVEMNNYQSDAKWETLLLSRLLSYHITSAVLTQEQENLLKCPSWEARVKMATELIGNRSCYGTAALKLIFNGIYDRVKALNSYTPSYKKLKSKIKLFKSEDKSMRGFAEDFGLHQFSEQQVDVEVFDGNHTTILDNLKLASALNSLISN